MWSTIINPVTRRKVSIYGKIGKQVLQKYFNHSGGGFKLKSKTFRKRSVRKRSNQRGGSLRRRSNRTKRSMKKRLNKQRGGGENQFKIFYADWCGHCKVAKPDFEALVNESRQGGLNINGNIVKVEMINGEQNREQMSKHNVYGFPTLMLIKDGEQVDYSGNRTKEHIKEWISDNF